MALFNYATKEITLKIVYYGPGLSGKTTNLQKLHSSFDSQKAGKLISLATETDRTLFFDFLPVDLGKIKDFTVRFQLYTVPGQVKYNATRKIVLKGADAIVFVADSQREMKEANIESFLDMIDNLHSNNIDLQDIPVVFQYNKRDLVDILSITELNSALNKNEHVYIEAQAINNKGVQETFQTITKLLIKNISSKHNFQIQQPEPSPAQYESPTEEIVSSSFDELEEFKEQPDEQKQVSLQDIMKSYMQVSSAYQQQEISEEPEHEQEVHTESSPDFEKEAGLEQHKEIPSSYSEDFHQRSVQIPAGLSEKWGAPQVSIEQIEKLDAKIETLSDKLKEITQLLINIKLSITGINNEVRDTKDEQKDIIDTLKRELGVEVKKEKKKRSWLGLKQQ